MAGRDGGLGRGGSFDMYLLAWAGIMVLWKAPLHVWHCGDRDQGLADLP